jgi:acylphosphatase
VRNCPDGSVEAVFEGDRERVQSMVDWCGRGPSGASIDSLDVEWERPTGEDAFTVV